MFVDLPLTFFFVVVVVVAVAVFLFDHNEELRESVQSQKANKIIYR